MKKLICVVLALVMALSFATTAWGADEDWYGGSDPANAAKLSEYLTNNVVADGTTINLTGAYYDLSLPAGTTVPKNLTIVGGGQNATPVVNCFIGADVDGLTLKNIWFMAGGGITGNSSDANTQVIKNMTVEGCFFEGSQGALNLGSSVCENMTIKNCKFLDTPSSNAIRLYNVSGITTITGNEIAQAPSYGVALLGTVAGTVNIGDNAVANITKGALRVDQIQAGAVVSITGNGKIADTALASGQVMKITSVAPGATVTITGIPSGAKTLVEEGNVTLTDSFSGLAMDANKKITGGTFDVAPKAEYLAAGKEATLTNGQYVVTTKTSAAGTTTTLKNADKYDIYEIFGTTSVKAANADITKKVTDKTTVTVGDKTTVTYTATTYSDGVNVYVEVDSTVATHKLVKGNAIVAYLADLAVVGDVPTTTQTVTSHVKAVKDAKCGQYDEMIFPAGVYMIDGKAYAVGGADWALYNGKFVNYGAKANAVAHTYVANTYSSTVANAVATVKCSTCKQVFNVLTADQVKTMAPNAYVIDPVFGYIAVGAGTAAGTTTDKVTSAETFDAGIAMYVGMSVMAAAGSAVVIGKKKD